MLTNTEKPATTLELPFSSGEQSVDIAQVTAEDIDLITRWTIALHQHEDDGKLKPHQHFEKNLKKWLSLEIDNNNSLFLLALIKQKPVGFIAGTSIINDNGLIAAPLKGFIQLLWVEEPFRKQKIAHSLLESIENCFLSIGIEYIECQYTKKNNLAHQFWQDKGYKANALIARKIIA